MTAYSSTLNLRMKDLYDKNYYTPQLPMRTFRNPYFLPTSNQLLFDILKKQSTTSTTATPPTSTSVPPSTTGPTRPAAAAKPKPAAPITKKPTAPTPKQNEAAKKIQDTFNKNTLKLKKDIAKRKAEEAKRKAADAAKAAAAAKTTAAPKAKAGGGKIAAKVFSPPPTFIKGESLDSKLAKIEAWKASQPPSNQMPNPGKQSDDLMKGNKLLKDLQNAKSNQKFKPLASIPTSLTSLKSALTKTNKQKPNYNPRLSDGQQSETYRAWKRQKEDLEDAIKKLSPKGAASKPIEKAGKQGDTTKLTDAATGTATKPFFEVNNIPNQVALAAFYTKLTDTQLATLASLYKSWEADEKAITDAQSANPTMRRSVKDKVKFIGKSQNKITKLKKQIVALENKGR